MRDINCPYCEAEQDINHDDGYGYEEDEKHQQECNSCGKTFTYTTSIIYCYDAEKADCLNGSDHDWQPSKTYPKCATTMVCNMCGGERKPTDAERMKYSIPTYDEYISSIKQ